MNFYRHEKSLFVFLFVLFLPLQACGLSGKAIEGKVVEQGTHKPIPNAIVIVRWHGYMPSIGHSQTVCVHVETTLTDEKGNFHIRQWRKSSEIGWVRDVEPIVTAYKPGYRLAEEYPETTPRLVSFAGTKEEKLAYVQRSSVSCRQAGESKKNLLPLAKALYQEALNLAETENEKKIVDNLLFSMEIIEFGYEVAERRDIERSRGRK